MVHFIDRMIINILCSNELVTIFHILLTCLFRNRIELVKFRLDMSLKLLLLFDELIVGLHFLLHHNSFFVILVCEELFVLLCIFMSFLNFCFLVFQLSHSLILFHKFTFNLFLHVTNWLLLLDSCSFL